MIGIIEIFTLSCRIDDETSLFVYSIINRGSHKTIANTRYMLATWQVNTRERISISQRVRVVHADIQECDACWYAGMGTQTRAESNESITDMTEGLPFFPLLYPCIGIRKLPAVLSYEGQIEISPSLACALPGFSRTRNIAAHCRIRQSIAYVSGGLNFRRWKSDQSGIKLPQNEYPTARLKYLRVCTSESCP